MYPARQSLRLDPSKSRISNISYLTVLVTFSGCCAWTMFVWRELEQQRGILNGSPLSVLHYGWPCALSYFTEAKCLKDEEILQTLPVGTTASFYFSDLGSQVTWGTVSRHTHRHACTHTHTHKHTHTHRRIQTHIHLCLNIHRFTQSTLVLHINKHPHWQIDAL